MANHQYGRIGSLQPSRNAFDLSHNVKMTANMGILYPCCCLHVVPGDTISMGAQIISREQPTVSPMLHEIELYQHSFFVPYRILWPEPPPGYKLTMNLQSPSTTTYGEIQKGWETFITGGFNGDDKTPLPRYPRQVVNSISNVSPTPISQGAYASKSLWDYLGYPPVSSAGYNRISQPAGYPDLMIPMDFCRLAYNSIFNEYYRDEHLQAQVPILPGLSSQIPDIRDRSGTSFPTNDPNTGYSIPYDMQLKRRNWSKDYFTASRPFRQLGSAGALPITSTNDVTFTNANGNETPVALITPNSLVGTAPWLGNLLGTVPVSSPTNIAFSGNGTGPTYATGFGLTSGVTGASLFPNNTAFPLHTDVSATFNVNDLRTSFQLQKWQERNARAGVRYKEFLIAHYGVTPSDQRLQRPEYIGGLRQPIMHNEVLQTSASSSGGTPQGNMAGHGLSADGTYIGSYNVKEFGVIMCILSIMPKRAYDNTMPRQEFYYSRHDFYSPEFAHLGEQGIYSQEIYFNAQDQFNGITGATQPVIFGFNGIFDEMRVMNDRTSGEFRIRSFDNSGNSLPSLGTWHLADTFSQAPLLNTTFLECNPDQSRVLATTLADFFMLNIQMDIKAIRPMPAIAEPGLVDHF